MTKFKSVLMIVGLALCFSAVSVPAATNPQIVPTTKRITKKVYHKGRYVTVTTYRHGKKITKKVWRTSYRTGKKIGTKTRHIVVGHHHRRP